MSIFSEIQLPLASLPKRIEDLRIILNSCNFDNVKLTTFWRRRGNGAVEVLALFHIFTCAFVFVISIIVLTKLPLPLCRHPSLFY